MSDRRKEFLELVGKDFDWSKVRQTVPTKQELIQLASAPSDMAGIEDDPDAQTKPGKWAVSGNLYYGCADVADKLPAGVYRACLGMSGPFLAKKLVKTDNLLTLPDDNSDLILAHIEEFWNSKNVFQEYGFVYKRGVLVYGPPGSGKTATVLQSMKKITDKKGIVLLGNSPYATLECLELVRSVEADRPIVVVLEDIDDIVCYYGDKILTEMLDGESNIDNVLYLATTNHPERLPQRLINRPSRFDVIEYIGMPEFNARKAFIQFKLPTMTPSELNLLSKNTEDFSLAHIKEVIVLMKVFNYGMDDAVNRVKTIMKNTFRSPYPKAYDINVEINTKAIVAEQPPATINVTVPEIQVPQPVINLSIPTTKQTVEKTVVRNEKGFVTKVIERVEDGTEAS
jgi:hypothetical protein